MPSLHSVVDLIVLFSFFLALRVIRNYRRRGRLSYPPGPRPLPVVGNLFHIPREFPWLAYAQYAKEYGDVISFQVLGRVVVVLNSIKATKDFFEKNGDTYSDRPAVPFYEMMGWHWLLPSASGDRWRLGRRVLDRGLRPGAAAMYRPMQQARAHVLLSRLLESPQKWEAHIELLQGELILAMTYGYEVSERDDEMIDAAQELSRFAGPRILPGALLVNEFAFLRHIPKWLPWLSYKPLASIGHGIGKKVLYPPIQFVKGSILNGTARPSLALENFQEIENKKLSGSHRDEAEEMVAGALGSMYAAGADTAVSAMMSFFAAMLLYPEIQKKAQSELDSVLERQRLPAFEDRPRLPFVDAICKEVLRWRPVTPLAIPHAATKDDVYAGFFIPKGAVVIGNAWAILRDPTQYPEPDVFKPERFLNPDGSLRDDPTLTSAFGFGKRICPGRHFVDATLFIAVASLLSVFNIARASETQDMPSDFSCTGAIISRPNSFPCSIVPRDKRAEELILADTMAR